MILAQPNEPSERGFMRPLSHLELLLTLVFLQISQSFLSSEHLVQRSVFNFILLFVVFSALRTLSQSKTWTFIALAAGVLGYALISYSEVARSVWSLVISDLCFLVVFSLLLLALGESVFSKGLSDLNRIIGAVCIYFIIGLLFALLYSLLETFQPESFSLSMYENDAAGHQDRFGQLLYFSNVTLTTLGYGDIQPVSRPARSFATLEALIGQLYLAIVIARLVGVHIANASRTRE
ncbi:potassium channel family protein [Rhodopirellula sp. SWK7]|uniref:potassium channel family protein n=1 Tax=Rhodopirellula sp. SWK7 TaxID=595460 RepID=UPI0002BFA7C7|nr:potassium channel family protein [Rhodopirellula sp. SWK7]EMI42269.1 Ion transport 2 domain protein [Rhodopirellula sp. SWK7]